VTAVRPNFGGLASEAQALDAVVARIVGAIDPGAIWLFGSRARGDDHSGSDTDIMIEVDPEADMSVYDYVGLKRYIASLFDGPVDVVNRDGLKPYIRPTAESAAVYAF